MDEVHNIIPEFRNPWMNPGSNPGEVLGFLNIRDPEKVFLDQTQRSGSRMPRKSKAHFVCLRFSRLRDDDFLCALPTSST